MSINNYNFKSRTNKETQQNPSSKLLKYEHSFDVGSLNFKSTDAKSFNKSGKHARTNSSILKGVNISNLIASEPNKLITNNNDINELEDVATLKLICKNLRNEIKSKNEEIKTLHSNIKEKLKLIEAENKIALEAIESGYKNLVENINNANENKINEMIYQSNLVKSQYEEIIQKLKIEYSYSKINKIDIAEHARIVQESQEMWKDNYEQLKKLFIEKLKDLINFFNKFEYKQVLEKINLYSKICGDVEKFGFNSELENYFKNNQEFFINEEYNIWVNKIRIRLVDIEKEYIENISAIEANYLCNYRSSENNKNKKLDDLQIILEERFKVLFYNFKALERISVINTEYIEEDEFDTNTNLKKCGQRDKSVKRNVDLTGKGFSFVDMFIKQDLAQALNEETKFLDNAIQMSSKVFKNSSESVLETNNNKLFSINNENYSNLNIKGDEIVQLQNHNLESNNYFSAGKSICEFDVLLF
jgi:hypothetical protein